MADIQPYLKRMVDQMNNPDDQKQIKGFAKSLQFRFTDTQEVWLLHPSAGGEMVLSPTPIEKPDVQVTTTTEILAGIMDKTIEGASAYMQGKIKVHGAMGDLMKLQRLFT